MKFQVPGRSSILSGYLAVIAATIIFRKPCTLLLVGFMIYNLFYIKQLKFSRPALWLTGIIALPFLLEIAFFWNNYSFSAGLKSAEKTLSMLLLPLFVLGNYKQIDLTKILYYFGRLIILFLLFCLARFIILYPDSIQKYLNGIELWDSGYAFARSFKSHAPAANMHIGFAAMVNFYFALIAFTGRKSNGQKAMALLFFTLSVLFVFILNTRLTIILLFVGCGIVLAYELNRAKNGRKLLRFSAVAAALIVVVGVVYVQNNSFMKEKFTTITFKDMDMVGRLDEYKNPREQIYNGLVTRLSIWKSCCELAVRHMPFGVGSSNVRMSIIEYYRETNQQFLYSEGFPAHNQLIDISIRFGIFGTLAFLVHILTIGWLALKTRHSIIACFFVVFALSNMVDDFLIRFDGIVFSAVWFSVFAAYWLQRRATPGNSPATA